MSDAIDAILQVTTEASPTESSAVRAAVAPQVRAAEFGEVLHRHTPVLLAAARALVRNEADARDLVQTTLEIATRKASELRDPGALRSWLLAVQIREAFRLRRRLAHLIHHEFRVLEMPSVPGPSADVMALRAALAKLPTRARAAVALHYLADLPVSEVARVMGISENTTKGHLKAGLARLRKELGDE